ncbi:MAG: flagellar export chaperone FliS [Chloroflexi bacterium]|nr:flagellar export chaperone FliS [Chloroflexota bacterium]
MTSPGNTLKSYQRLQTQTSSPAQLVVLLYTGAIRFLTVARQKLEAGDIESAHRSLLRGQEIVLELMVSVDTSVGPVAQNLFDLYEFIHRHLIQANIKKDSAMILDVEVLLRELLPAWEQAIAADARGSHARVSTNEVRLATA